jgi:hypoxanthine phosphoribosyltransferase
MTSDTLDILLSPEEIASRVATLGATISHDYAELDLVLLGVLRGAVPFLADLTRAIAIPHTFDMIGASSYGGATVSSGDVRITRDAASNLKGRHIIVVEDIYDTGNTLQVLLALLRLHQPASLEVCALLVKDRPREHNIPIKYTGFTIPNRFVVGYGLDHADRYRHLPYVAVLDEKGD